MKARMRMKAATISLGCLFCLGLALASAPVPARLVIPNEEFTAVANMPSVNGNAMVGPGAASNVNIFLDNFTSDAEARAMASAFASGGYKSLRSAFKKATLKGRITMEGRNGSYELKLLRSKPTEGGRRIFAVGERAIRFLDAYYPGRSQDYQFGILELDLKTDGSVEEGTGTLVYGGRIKTLEADSISLEDFGIEPVRLTGVRKQ